MIIFSARLIFRAQLRSKDSLGLRPRGPKTQHRLGFTVTHNGDDFCQAKASGRYFLLRALSISSIINSILNLPKSSVDNSKSLLYSLDS